MLRLQTNSEVLATVLAALCIASPTIEARLKELEPGRGRKAAAQQIEGASSVFAIGNDISSQQKQVQASVISYTLALWNALRIYMRSPRKPCRRSLGAS